MLDPRFKSDESSDHKKQVEPRSSPNDDRKAGLITDREPDEQNSDDSGLFETDKLSETSSFKSGQNGKSGHRRHSKVYSKNIKLTLNLLYLALKDADYAWLEGHESLFSQLIVYMTSEISLRNTEREAAFVTRSLLETQSV